MVHKPILVLITLCLLSPAKSRAQESVSNGDSLGLMIMGTITNKSVEDNVALVKEASSGRVHAVKKGYTLLENFYVEVVTHKYLVISNNGKKHLIYQNKFASAFSESKKPTTPANDSYIEEGFERNESEIRMTASYRDNLINNQLSTILMQATALPNYVGGTMNGFKLLQIDKGSIYEKAGLADGDIITRINGIKLNDISAAIKLLNNLKGSDEISFDFTRDEKPQTRLIVVR